MTQRKNTGLIAAAAALIELFALPALEASVAIIIVYGASGQVGGAVEIFSCHRSRFPARVN
jgi:hypothetical protein